MAKITAWQWARIAALVVAALLVIGLAIVASIWQDRQSLDDIGWPVADVDATATSAVSVTWLGTTTLLFDDRETQILIDGNFTSLNPLQIALLLPVTSDVATINYALAEWDMNRLAAIIPVHSHFDHAMDVGHVANRTSAVILGSESTANIARGAAVPVNQYQILADGETRQFGNFTIRLIASVHAPIGPDNEAWFPGTIDYPLAQPASVDDWKEGVVWSVVLQHPRGTTLIQGSGGFVENKLDGVFADVALLGIGGLAKLGQEYVTKYWDETVPMIGARRVIAIHHDDYTADFGEVRLLPDRLDNISLTASWIDKLREREDYEITVELPPFGQPIPLY